MAPWPELENSQHDPNKYIEGATSQQPTPALKGKETDNSKCLSSSSCSLACCGEPRSLRPDSSLLLAFAVCLGR